MANSSQNLWDFSTRLYGDCEIQDRCLALQDQHDIDIPLMLWCCWYGEYFGVMSTEHLSLGITFSTQWRDQVVAHLRASRRWMKGREMPQDAEQTYNKLRESIKSAELAAEKYQLTQLELISDAVPGQHYEPSASKENFSKLLTLSGIVPTQDLLDNLRKIAAKAAQITQQTL